MVEHSQFFDRRMALCVILPLVIVTSTAYWRWNGLARRLHDDARRALDSMGLADNLENLARRLKQTEDHAKAERWKTLVTTIRHQPGPMQPVLGRVRTIVPPHGETWELEPAARSFVESHGAILAELCELNKNPAVLSLAPDTDFLNQWLDSASDNLLLSAGLDLVGCVALRDNDEAGVLRAIQNLYKCRKTLQGVAPAIGALVRFDLSQRGLFLLKMGLERGLFGRKSLELLQPMLLEHVEVDSGWLAAIEFELAMHLDIMNGQAELKHYPAKTASPIAIKVARCIFPPASMLDRARFLNLIRNLAELPTNSLEDFQAARSECIGLYAEQWTAEARFDFRSTGFAYDHTLGSAFQDDAMRHRMAASAVAVQLHRIESGSYPKSLDEVAAIAANEHLRAVRGTSISYVQANSSATIWIANLWIPTQSTLQTPAIPRDDLTVVWTLNTP